MIKNKKYKEYNIYYPEKEMFYKELGKKIVDKQYEELEVYKNTERNYVAKIEVEGITEYAVPFLAIVKKNIFIKESYILMECVDGEPIKTIADIDKIMEIINKLHKEKIYHGDLNTSNFIKTKNGIRIIDTQGKKERFFYFKRWNDFFIMQNDLLVIDKKYKVEEKYYKKNKGISYYIILTTREIKKLKFIEWIKFQKKKLRKKGWRI